MLQTCRSRTAGTGTRLNSVSPARAGPAERRLRIDEAAAVRNPHLGLQIYAVALADLIGNDASEIKDLLRPCPALVAEHQRLLRPDCGALLREALEPGPVDEPARRDLDLAPELELRHLRESLLQLCGLRPVNHRVLEEAAGVADLGGIREAVADEKLRLITIQRSKGYASRRTLSVSQIGEAIACVKSVRPDVICMVDNW